MTEMKRGREGDKETERYGKKRRGGKRQEDEEGGRDLCSWVGSAE